MRDKRFPKIFYKNINIHPFCPFYFRYIRYCGENGWYIIYKGYDSDKLKITRDEVKKRLNEELDYWYKEEE